MFRLLHSDRKTSARAGRLKLCHGTVETPLFMPVATKGAVKFISTKELEQLGTKTIISNSFLLSLRPGLKAIADAGGLHSFIGWKRGIFTDSGGFQILRQQFFRGISDEGVSFHNPFDRVNAFLSPEKCIQIQNSLGSDVAMVLDDVPSHDKSKKQVAVAVQRTTDWAKRCKAEHSNKKQLLFGICQGGKFKDLRKKSVLALNELDFDGLAIGGLSIGEPKSVMNRIAGYCMPFIPEDKPRYVMGLGSPADLLDAIALGADVFDSCFPTRMARHGHVFTFQGKKNIDLATNRFLQKPLDETCGCFVCRNFSSAFLHHLFRTHEENGQRYLSWHNLFFTQRLMKEARLAIKENRFSAFRKGLCAKYKK
ncbi:MAG: tRNA guanosine(34) transglycosylase Tgt [Candidatus Diapherotrites archaeon]|nr:tRNA guanosine(34) transglycosylase Tgt [Candidatus Diapherotrites archaeon]